MDIGIPSLRLAVAPLEHALSGRDGPLPAAIAGELRAIADRLRELASTTTLGRSTLRREGEYWTIAHDGTVLRLRHSKGVAYLARLLAAPDTELHVLTIETDRPVDVVTSSPRLDAAAKAAYRDRLVSLRASYRDPHGELIETAPHAEIAALVRELAAGVGLGGRDRSFATAAERARVNVTRSVRRAIDRIADGHLALGRHLATSVRTGLFCSYAPDPGVAIRWQIEP